MLKNTLQNSLILAVTLFMLSGCVPNHVEVGLNSQTLGALNKIGDSAKQAAEKIKVKGNDLKGMVQQGLQQAQQAVQNVQDVVSRNIQSIRDHSRTELANAILSNEDIRKATELLETAQKVQCYSDQKEYLKFKKLSDQSYSFRLVLICFDGSVVPGAEPTDPTADPGADNGNQPVSTLSATLLGTISWSKEDGLKVVSDPGTTPDVCTDSLPLSTIKSVQENYVRVLPPAAN